MTEAEAQLFALLRDRCYREGKFQLSSGDTSNYYFDGKMIELSSEGAFWIGQVIYERIKDLDVNAVGGLRLEQFP